MKPKWVIDFYNKWGFYPISGGKGETTIQAAPVTPAPSPSETAKDVYAARLQYDPQIARAEYELQSEYMPKQAAIYSALYNQYMPQYARSQQAMQQGLYPQQSQIMERGATNVLQNLISPYNQQISQGVQQQTLAQLQQPQTPLVQAMTQQAMGGLQPSAMAGLSELEAIRGLQPNALFGAAEQQARQGIIPSSLQGTIEQQARANVIPNTLQQQMEQQAIAGLTSTGLSAEQQSAIDIIRGRMAGQLSQRLRERSNLGGTLYGGRSQQLESQGLQELGQRFAAEDVDRLLANRQAAMQQALGVQGAGLQQQQLGLQGLMGAGQFGLAQQQQGLMGLTGVAGLQEQARQQALANLMSATQIQPGLQQQALGAAQGVAGLGMQQQQQALQNAMALQQQQQQAINPYLQILYPQVGTQQPNISPYQYQSAVPSADALYNAYFQASQPQRFAIPGKQGVSLGPLGQWGMY